MWINEALALERLAGLRAEAAAARLLNEAADARREERRSSRRTRRRFADLLAGYRRPAPRRLARLDLPHQRRLA
ncbi:MAG: hypothetical protein ACRDV1_14440 [Actinomycetes bacterium]